MSPFSPLFAGEGGAKRDGPPARRLAARASANLRTFGPAGESRRGFFVAAELQRAPAVKSRRWRRMRRPGRSRVRFRATFGATKRAISRLGVGVRAEPRVSSWARTKSPRLADGPSGLRKRTSGSDASLGAGIAGDLTPPWPPRPPPLAPNSLGRNHLSFHGQVGAVTRMVVVAALYVWAAIL